MDAPRSSGARLRYTPGVTAEIAIMNAQAVALAADSAVSFGSKVKNTANKIFALSKFEPVGVMIYNNAEYLGMPWETVLKHYRQVLGQKSFPTVKDYAADFLSFIQTDALVLRSTVDPARVRQHCAKAFVTIREYALAAARKEIETAGPISPERLSELLHETIIHHDTQYRENEQEHTRKRKVKTKASEIDESISAIFGQLPLSPKDTETLRALGEFVIQHFPLADFSGIVIAGFGRDELFPSLESYIVNTFADGDVLYVPDRCASISTKDRALIVPFAQSEVVATLMDGVDPGYQGVIDQLISDVVQQYPAEILNQIGELSDKEREALAKRFADITPKIAESYLGRLKQLRAQNFSTPITSVVQALPKEELAAMAEALVNLTSFKRKISLDPETVGGPIDVAVISRGDGLIWIKRKHYFEPKFNPQFFDLYYWKDRNEEKDNT